MKKMLNNFKISYNLKAAYVSNQFIYSLQQIPLLGKIFPNSLYGLYEVKLLHIFITIIKELFKTFIYKIIYVLIFIVFPLSKLNLNNEVVALTMYLCLSLIGAFFKTEMFEASKDKYYLITLMKMDAKSYTISSYIYYILTTFIGHFIALLILTKIKMPLVLLGCLTMVSMKTIYSSIKLSSVKKDFTKITKKSAIEYIISITISLLAITIAYILPFNSISIPENIIYIVSILSILFAIPALINIIKFNNYQKLYKNILKEDNIFIQNANIEMNLDQNKKIITNDVQIDSTKEGYAYFNDIFTKRHKKVLNDKAKVTSIVIIVVSIAIILFALFSEGAKEDLINIPLNYLPYMLLLMYFINVGDKIANILFTNCDRSMLTYRFYRQPKYILGLFKERLKTIIKINFLPTILLATGLCTLLFVCNDQDIIHYLVVFATIISMSVFFSVHNLVIYYLLQPYSIDMEMKSKLYQIITGLTYIICYSIYDLKIPLMYFGTTVIAFSIIYVLISLLLVYKLAPKTFKLK